MERVAVRSARYRVYVGMAVLLMAPATATLLVADALSVGSMAVAGAVSFVVMLLLWLSPHDLSFGLTFVEDDADEGASRLDAHLAFGFAPDPVFPELEWDDDEE